MLHFFIKNTMKYLFFFFLTFATFAQSNDQLESTLKKYDDYFKTERESLYLHLNKSTYLRGEYVWFQGYSYNRQTQKLNYNTRNVELRIFNEEGRIIEKQLLLSNGGIFSGQVKIDSTYKDGIYYLKAETNWMRNFKEDYAHVQKFEVLDSIETNAKSKTESYDIKMLPEGGYLVRELYGRLGIKIIDNNGLGVKFRGTLLENNKELIDFKSNRFGHALINILPKENSDYKIKFYLPKGTIIEKEVGDIKEHGIVMSVSNNVIKDAILIDIHSNLKDYSKYSNTNLELLLHREGNILHIPIELTSDKKSQTKILSNDLMFYGVNTFTLLRNGKPILERLVFNDLNSIDESSALNLAQTKTKDKDSLSFKLDFKEILGSKKLSVSVLPSKTLSYKKNKNIISSFLLEPFINGYIEDAGYYFLEPNKKKQYNLDLLLLTQGWSRYDWNNILDESPEVRYERKNGLTQTIEIENKVPKRAKALMVNNETQNNIRIVDLDQNTAFRLENTYPFKDDKLSFSFIKNNNQLMKPYVLFSTDYVIEDQELKLDYLMPSISDERRLKNKISHEQVYFNFKSEFQLDEVKLYADSDDFSDIKYNSGLLNLFRNKVKIDKEAAIRYILLSQYLNANGYIVVEGVNGFSISDRRAGIGVVIMLDGVILNDLSILSRTYTRDYEMIGYNRLGFGLPRRASYIYLETRKTPLFDDRKIHQYNLNVIEGFEVSKTYYMPQYSSFKTESFQQFGTISWISNLSLEENEVADIAIYDTGLNKVTFFIEGITEDGSLINIEKEVEVR
jgi:hypothetical protein